MPDVNLLVYAHQQSSHNHEHYAAWLSALANGDEPYALSEPVLESFIRLVTNPKVFRPATPLAEAFAFVDRLAARPNARLFRPGDAHFAIFRQLCTVSSARGNLVSDAAHAALAIEHGCTWCSADTDFKRFEPFLRWEHI